jgi:hypothetical protein
MPFCRVMFAFEEYRVFFYFEILSCIKITSFNIHVIIHFSLFSIFSWFIPTWEIVNNHSLFVCLFIHCFTSRSRMFHLYGDVTIAGEGLRNLGLCLALRAFEQGGILIVPQLLWHGTLVFQVSSKGRLLRHTRGCGWYFLTRILMGTNGFEKSLKVTFGNGI